MLDLDVGDLDAPGIGLGIQGLLDIDVEAFALGQHLVQLVLAEHRAQGGLGQLAGGHEEVLHLDDGALRVQYTEIDHRVDLHRDVVAGDHVLRRYVQHHGAQVHPHHLLDGRDDQHQPRSLDPPEAPELEHHPSLVLAQDADG
ncbi:hypothetical protein FQZ97_741240 [compost metagenome]